MSEHTWVSVECAFTCRMCGFVVPLNQIDTDGAVSCVRCGLEQAFEVRAWGDALRHAHCVGAGQESSRTLEVGGANRLRITARPGRPECASCGGALEIAFGEKGRVDLTCKSCGKTDGYVIPAQARNMSKGKLIGVIATQHLADREAVKVERSAGAVAVQCPSCNASLPPPDDSKLVTCKYCNTVSRIPDNVAFLLNGREPVAEAMWLLFKGPTAIEEEAAKEAQSRAERARKQEEGRRRKEAAKAEARERNATARVAAEREQAARNGAKAQAEEQRQSARRERAESERRQQAFIVAAIIGIVVVAGAITVWLESSNKKSPSAVEPKSGHGGDGQQQPRAKPPEPPPAYVAVPSCGCISRAGSAKNTFALEAPVPGESQWFISWEQKSGFMTSTMPFAIDAADQSVLTPAAGAKSLALAIACEGAIVALVSANVATAWEGNEQKSIWTVKLPAPFDPSRVARDAGATAKTVGAAIDVSCPTVLPVEAGKIALSLAGGKRATISMNDGVVH